MRSISLILVAGLPTWRVKCGGFAKVNWSPCPGKRHRPRLQSLIREDRGRFKELRNCLLEAESPVSYNKTKEDLENLFEEDNDRKYLNRWVEW